MDCILLAAGYATRLYPLTENMPKALLRMGNKTILDMVIDKIEQVDDVNNIYIVTNHKFYINFADWADKYTGRKKVIVINDFTTSNDNRLGAIGDMQYVIDNSGIDDELLVMASDNIFDFSLVDYVKMYREKNADMICANKADENDDLHAMGVAEIDDDGRVLSFEEKPENPKSDWGVSPFYLYKRETAKLIKKYLDEGNNPDAPGHFIPWLLDRNPVYAFTPDGMRIDIGTPKSYYAAQKMFE